MRVRRCATLMLEPRERLEFSLSVLSGGGSGLHRVIEWVALAPHCDGELLLSPDEVVTIGAVSPSGWIELEELAKKYERHVLDSLLDKQLLVPEESSAASRDQKLRDTHWRNASAVMHYASRWHGVDTEDVREEFAENAGGQLVDWLGPAPPLVREHTDAIQRIPLPRSNSTTALDALFDRRVTCRNYDRSRKLSLEQFSAVLHRAFGARAVDDYAPGIQLMKKGVPSAGGLHATEAYLIVQHVDGIAPGLYHYHPVDHALEPIAALEVDAAAVLAKRCVAAQSYFVDAHALVIPTSRFRRNFWKYRNHAKAYRALILDVGHLSQALYLAATELGLAAFVTAAINEMDIEQAFGLDPLEEGPLAVCGFGYRADARNEAEFDPLNAVWAAEAASPG